MRENPLILVALSRKPWDQIAIYLKWLIHGSRYKYLPAITDYFNNMTRNGGNGLGKQSGRYQSTEKFVARLRLLREMVSDNGDTVCVPGDKHFLKGLNIRHTKVSLHAPRQNGLVERFNHFLDMNLGLSMVPLHVGRAGGRGVERMGWMNWMAMWGIGSSS